MNQGHLDPFVDLMTNLDGKTYTGPLAEVEIQAQVSAPFGNAKVVSVVRLNCVQHADCLSAAQEKATEQAMEGLRNGWEILQEKIKKGYFPGSASS